jgi:hypothetical protein
MGEGRVMKKFSLLFLFVCAAITQANSRELIRYAPQYSFHVIGADLVSLRDNEIFVSMEQKGQIWSYEEDSDVAFYFKTLKIEPKRDIKSFLFSKYLNSYGSSGKLHVFELTRDVSPTLQQWPSTKYLKMEMFRLHPDQDKHVTLLTPNVLATGSLNEVKMAVDLARGKLAPLQQNGQFNSMLQKLPAPAAVWGLAAPLSRRKAAAAKAQQSTNAILQGFETYYFYGVPTKTQAKSHFYGQTADEKDASLMTAFMIGTLTLAKFRADEPVAEMLDQVDIQHNGRTIHVSAVLTREMVDAYFEGDFGIK